MVPTKILEKLDEISKLSINKFSKFVKYKFPSLIGAQNKIHWARVIMDKETERFVRSLNYKSFNALEISGSQWKNFGFSKYTSVQYPDFNVCKDVLEVEPFDLIIAEQVLEHVLWPSRAVRNLYQMLGPSGILMITTPFLLKIHNSPVDCYRWTELGLKCLLTEGGFENLKIKTGSWGNRMCIVANFKNWCSYIPGKHSLKNEQDFPVVIWGFAQK